MKKTIIMGSVDVNKVKEQIKSDMQKISNKSETDNVSEKNIGDCRVDLVGSLNLKKKPFKNNTFCIELFCGLKKKDSKLTIKERLTRLFSKEENK